VGVLRGAPSSVGTVMAVVWFEGVTADDGGEVTGGWDTDRGGRRKRAWRICSFRQLRNIFCILLIRCTSVSLFFEEIGRDAPRYWAHESGESSTELLVARIFVCVGNIGGEDDIF